MYVNIWFLMFYKHACKLIIFVWNEIKYLNHNYYFCCYYGRFNRRKKPSLLILMKYNKFASWTFDSNLAERDWTINFQVVFCVHIPYKILKFQAGFCSAETGWILKFHISFRSVKTGWILKFQTNFCLRNLSNHQVSVWFQCGFLKPYWNHTETKDSGRFPSRFQYQKQLGSCSARVFFHRNVELYKKYAYFYKVCLSDVNYNW